MENFTVKLRGGSARGPISKVTCLDHERVLTFGKLFILKESKENLYKCSILHAWLLSFHPQIIYSHL